MSPNWMFSSLATLGVFAAATYGQTVANPQQSPRPQTPQGQLQPGQPQPGQAVQGQAYQGRQTAGQNLDQTIAGCLLLANEEEIALAKFADGKAKSDKVKEFARMLADDHRKVVDDLQTVAPQQAQAAKNLGEGSQRQTASATNRAGARQQGGGQDAHFEMGRRTAEECLKLTKQMLEEAEGEEFDQAFVGSQVGAHIAMLAKLRGAEAFASPRLQPIIAESISSTEQHLDHAKQLCKSLKDEAGQGERSNDQASTR